jgi:mRNA interferase MazF
MARLSSVRQWDLFRADLNFPVGSEQGGENRPVLIVSNDGFNAAFPVVTVLPLTKTEGKKRKLFDFEILIPAGLCGNDVESIIMPYQIRTVDKKRLLEHMGRLEDVAVRSQVEDRIIEHIGVDLDDEAAE